MNLPEKFMKQQKSIINNSNFSALYTWNLRAEANSINRSKFHISKSCCWLAIKGKNGFIQYFLYNFL